MRTSRFTEEQIRYAVQQAEAGLSVPELCRKYGVAPATFYRWRQKYGALTKSELARLKDLERENGRPKKLVAELTLDKQILQILQDVLAKKLRPARRREHVGRIMDWYRIVDRDSGVHGNSCRTQSLGFWVG